MLTTTITRPSLPTNPIMPRVLPTFCSSLPSHRLPKPPFLNPNSADLSLPKPNPNSADLALPKPNPNSELALRLPLPLPAPEIPAQMKEKILSLELMGLNAGRTLCLNPAVRYASLDSIQRIVHYLLSKGVRYKDLSRIFGQSPKILTSDIRRDLGPVFEFLSKELEVPDKYFYKVLLKCPKILVTSVRDQLRPALFYLQRLGIKDKNTLAYRQPVLLVLNIEETLIPKLDFIKSLGFSHGEACKMVTRSPSLLTFSIEKNFKPKLKYFFEEMKGELKEIEEFPQYFAFSLEQRIKPRHRELVERGVRMDLADMLKSVDLEFRNLVRDLERGSLVNSGRLCG